MGRCGGKMRRRGSAQREGHQDRRRDPGGYAKLAAQAKSGAINNVSTDGSTSELSRMAAEGLIEEIDWAAIDPKPMFDEAKNKYGFGSSYYSTIMAGERACRRRATGSNSSTPRSSRASVLCRTILTTFYPSQRWPTE